MPLVSISTTTLSARLAEKTGSNVLLWDSSRRAAKGTLGPVDGSRGMIDAIHHAANMARIRSLAAAQEMLAESLVDREPRFFASLEGRPRGSTGVTLLFWD